MKSINKMLLIFTVLVATTITVCTAQIKNAKTETVKVYGNCGMCKTAIEKAGNLKKVSKVEWNNDTKMATITYDTSKTDKDAILKKIALAGYDSDSFSATEAAYNDLPGCCQYERVNELAAAAENAGREDSEKLKMATSPNATGTPETNILQPIYDAYFSLKDALVKSDSEVAAAKAKDLQSAINGVEMKKLSIDVHMVWMKLRDNLKGDADHISGSKELEQQREYFTTLSKNIYSLVKVSKPNETVYYDHCPMYNNGKGGDWLSKESAIKNPYYGSMMLSCGKTVETIK